MSSYPKKLQGIIDLFESLSEQERRENLIVYSERASKIGPKDGQSFDIEDVRKDEECTDTVGIFLSVDEEGGSHVWVTLGPQVQTLTKAMASILVKGLDGVTPQDILDLENDFVPRIIGAQLVRQRSQTTYYVLSRIKGACKVYLNRKRREAAEAEG